MDIYVQCCLFVFFSFSGLVDVSPCGLQLEWPLHCILVCTVKTQIFFFYSPTKFKYLKLLCFESENV